jgi:hypothetical protein
MRAPYPEHQVSVSSRAGDADRMEIPKDKIIALIRDHQGGDKADQAQGELPDKVDPERHGDLLSKFGVDPKELLGGGLGSKLGL